MSRTDLFDITSIPGIDALAHAGHVPPDPAALHAARARLDAAIVAERTTGESAPVRGSRPRNRRRWAVRGVAVAAAVALVPLGRIALDSAQPQFARVAVASDGSLRCSNEGYAAPIAPSDADLRLLPTTLPDGWTLGTIAARWSTSNDPAACTTPALSLLRTDAQQVVTATVSVFGPFAGVNVDAFIGSRSTVDVAGDTGLLLDGADAGFQRWVWTADGDSWVMEAQELSRDEGTILAAAITTTDGTVDWEPSGDDLDLSEVARRAGPPQQDHPARLDWYVDFVGPDGRSAHVEVQYQPEHPTPAAQTAYPGVTLSPDHSQARLERPGEGDNVQLTIWRDGLTIWAGAGQLFGDPDRGTPQVELAVLDAIVESLAPAPSDDPRLDEHALDEDTVDHP